MPAMALEVSIFLSGLQILGELGGTEMKKKFGFISAMSLLGSVWASLKIISITQ